jgi:hypothetical protein
MLHYKRQHIDLPPLRIRVDASTVHTVISLMLQHTAIDQFVHAGDHAIMLQGLTWVDPRTASPHQLPAAQMQQVPMAVRPELRRWQEEKNLQQPQLQQRSCSSSHRTARAAAEAPAAASSSNTGG